VNLFLKDNYDKCQVSWEELILELNNTNSYNPYCKSNSYFEIFKNIVFSMLIGKEIILLDSDFTQDELKSLIGYSEYEKFNQKIKIDKSSLPKNKSELIQSLKSTKDEWKITLFTSGTTGIPKRVTHGFSSIARFVKSSTKNANNVWGFAYNPTHMAGLQVFLQALINGNSIVRLFGLSNTEIYEEIKENNITHISATPTFYRLLLPCNDVFYSVKRITSGGEKFNIETKKQLDVIFPNAKITNVYASTEAGTLFASENDVFTIKEEYEHLVKIEKDELLIHNSLMGNSEMDINEWYNTGDLVETVTHEPLKFRFLSRKSDMINVGGYKVNPIEVEETILTIPGIKDARVFSKSNSVLGNIICCEIISSDDLIEESAIRSILESKIQEFKIPRIIRFVDKISTTRTGKLKRN